MDFLHIDGKKAPSNTDLSSFQGKDNMSAPKFHIVNLGKTQIYLFE